ncbi:MAG: NAD-dependent epimerase/dehydratase family protein [Actinomycetota bacterium]|nr:NAD-dependent epimerase/dehydratase family protein [Actinomycetota bacterium]
MKIFVTGGTGFIGGHVVRMLRERGDEVTALVRSPRKAESLRELGAELVEGDLSDRNAIATAMRGSDAAVHGAAVFEVGIPRSEHEAMHQANVVGTENALGAARDAGVGKVVYISTIAAFGNTNGEVVDESYDHPAQSFTSYYEETKYEAHQVAKALIADGLPCVMVQPGGVYGPDDHSAIGKQILDFASGRMPFVPFPKLGMTMVYVEDVAAGVLLALDRGEVGQSYVLGGEITTMRDLMDSVAKVTGKREPRGNVPTGLLKAMAPAGPLIGKLMGQPPNMRELISSSDGVTFWASSDKAEAKLGYAPRPLERGLRETLEAEGKLAS